MKRKAISNKNVNRSLVWSMVQNRRSSAVIATVAGMLIFCATLGFAVRAYSRAATPSPVNAEPATSVISPPPARPPVVQSQSPDEDFQVKLVTLREKGFDPEELTVSQRRFVLAIENRSRLHAVDIQLLRVTGNKLHEVHMPRGRSNWNSMLELPPGEYVLTEASHPTWTCNITVRPH